MEHISNLAMLTMVRCVLFGIYLTVGLHYLFFNEKHERGRYLLSAILLMWGFEIIKDGVSQFFPWFADPIIRKSYLLVDLLVIPLCCFFLMEQIYSKWISVKRIFLHVALFIFWPIAFFCTKSEPVYDLALISSSIYGFLVICKFMKDLRSYHKTIGDMYSFKEDIDLAWVSQTLILFAVNLVLCIIIYSNLTLWSLYLYYPYCLAMWLFVIYHMEKQSKIMPMEIIACKEEEMDDVISSTSDSRLIKQLTDAFEHKKLYLNAQLSIYDVAKELGTNRTYISNCINNDLQTNFYDFVNAYRLNVAKKLLVESNEKISVIALNSGFNCFSTFLRTFRKKYGCTPQEYRNNQ